MSGEITGSVTDEDGWGIGNCIVRFLAEDGFDAWTKTEGNGDFSESLLDDTYDVVVSVPGFEGAETTVTVDGSTETVDLTLERRQPKMVGQVAESFDVGVRGRVKSFTGETVGVMGSVESADGYGLYTPDNARIDGLLDAVGEFRVQVGTDGDTGNIVMGDQSNAVDGHAGATIAGGSDNFADSLYATIGGGEGNEATDFRATVSGGTENTASGSRATIGGGEENTASGARSTVGGGEKNEASGTDSTVGGGDTNEARGDNATVSGGEYNIADAEYATIGGGGLQFGHVADSANRVDSEYGTIAGGGNNQAGTADQETAHATVGGGINNEATERNATIAGGRDNTASGENTMIGGGNGNESSDEFATVAGGEENTASDSHGVVTGGYKNEATDRKAAVTGGEMNEASGPFSTVCGGRENTATGFHATVSGGHSNEATESSSHIPGGMNNTASGAYSMAAGRQANAEHEGCFVWSDSNTDGIATTGSDQFLVDAVGGVGIGTDEPQSRLHVDPGRLVLEEEASSYEDGWAISNNVGMLRFFYSDDVYEESFDQKGYISNSDGSYNSVSDQRLKTDIAPLEEALDGICSLEPVSYRMKGNGDEDKSLGFLAQQVREYFPDLVSETESADTDSETERLLGLAYDRFGVLAIRGIQEQQDQIQSCETQIERLQSDLDKKEDDLKSQQEIIQRQQTKIEAQAEQIAELEEKIDALDAVVEQTP